VSRTPSACTGGLRPKIAEMRRRFGKPTTAGYVVFAILAIIVVGIVVGVIVGGAVGRTVDAVGGFLIVAFILLLIGPMTPRRSGDDPRDHGLEPPGPTGLH
jgi:uncharacterized membrane protein YfcA